MSVHERLLSMSPRQNSLKSSLSEFEEENGPEAFGLNYWKNGIVGKRKVWKEQVSVC